MPRARRPRRPAAGRPPVYTDAQILAALKATKGMVYLAARSIGCSATTIYERAKTVEAVAEVMKEENGTVDDVAEMKLYEAILAGESWAIQFRLSFKGKHRGYSQKSEVELTGAKLALVEEIIDVPNANDPKDHPAAPGPE